MNLKLARGIFGALVVGALGFGTTQALASPVKAAAGGECFYYQEQMCQDYCAYNFGAQGRCSRLGGSYDCQCYYGLPNEPLISRM